MSNRTLTALLFLQTLTLTALVADRLIPAAHADGPMSCEINNWPALLTGSGYSNLRVQIEEVRTPVPITVKGWQTSDRVTVQP